MESSLMRPRRAAGGEEAKNGPHATLCVREQQAVVGKSSGQRSPFTRDHEFRWEIILGATSAGGLIDEHAEPAS
jgi:hypothetical protein